MAGTLDPNKNPLRFIEIARQMLKADLNVHFIWIGGGETGYGLYVKQKAREAGLAAKVSFLGEKTEDYYDWLNAANGLVVTSFKESFSIVSVEAAHLGKPIVSFDCGGVKEIVRDGMGAVIDSWNNADLIQTMVAVMKGEIFFDPQVSKERVREFFIDVQGERWVELMRKHFPDREGYARQLETLAHT
jgi:glycosyltransferase involved in cell wall biosynthesis